MRLILIRHAESVANAEGRWQGHADFALSERGEQQAEKVAQAIKCAALATTVIYSSPLKRARATADAIASALGAAITEWDALKEYDVGAFSGRTLDEIRADKAEWVGQFEKTRDWHHVPGAETPVAREQRGIAVIEQLLNLHPDGSEVICVTHGGIMQFFLAAILGTERVWGIRPGNTAVFEFHLHREEDSTGRAHLNPYLCRIEQFNNIGHLAP